MILIAAIAIAGLLCALLAFSSYLARLYLEAMRFRPRANGRSLKFFEQHLQPALNLPAADGIRRYTLARQLLLVLLTLDWAVIASRNQDLRVALLEALLLSIASMMVFAQILPSILVSRTEGNWAAGLTPLARGLAVLVQPLVLLTRFADTVAELAEHAPQDQNVPSASDEIEALLDAGEEEGLIEQEDRKLIQSVVEFGDKTVREVMTPRPEMVAIAADATARRLRELLIEEEYSRVPVYEGSIDRIAGFVHSRDTLELDEEQLSNVKVRELMRPVALVPESKPIRELLREMQERNAHMAVVVDEYGQTAGLVTMEDLMEEIVGEIRDESEPEPDVVTESENSFITSGNLDLDRLEELAGFRPGEEFESTTLGGLICEHLGQVPAPGAKMRLDGVLIEVLRADPRRVHTVRVRRIAGAGEPGQPAEAAGGAAARGGSV